MTQPEALRLADYLKDRQRLDLTCDEAAAELRRLHEVNQELLAALQACADSLQAEIWNSGEDEDGNAMLQKLVQRVKKARAAINKAKRTTP